VTIDLRVADTDADLELWRTVRMALLPNERTLTVAEMQAQAAPGQLLLLAFRDGKLAGSGITSRSDSGGAFTQPRVLPGHRRRGVGTGLLRTLAAHALDHGFTEAGAQVEEQEALPFAARFGFVERGRQIEQVRAVARHELPTEMPEGIELVQLAGRADLAQRLYPELVREALRDFAVDPPIEITEEIWWSRWLTSTDATFVALDGDEIVGMAGLMPVADQPDRAENALTAVRRDQRRRGIARALKQHTIHVASQRGLREIYSWTQTGNEPMQALNRSLGYVDRTVVVTVRATLPLP